MPTISMFYGMLILMFYRDNRQHNLPHVHVRYQGLEAVVSIPDGQFLQGDLPPKQTKLLLAWMALHEEELMIDWGLAVEGQEPFRIPPLQ